MEHGSSKDLHKSNAVATKEPCGQAFVLGLPDELLAKIFECLAGRPTLEDATTHHPDRKYGSGDPNIGLARLTCRRFRDTSSHLLLYRVSVHLTPASLQRLETISQHPTIGKGVRSVRVNLSYYDRVLAHDFTIFARQVSQYMHDRFGARVNPQRARDFRGGAAMVQVCQMHWALRGVSLDRPEAPDEDDHAYRELARVAHAYYKESWLEQESIVRDGYAGAVASAVARMPFAHGVEFCAANTFAFPEMDKQTHIQLPFVRASKEGEFRDLARECRPLFSLLALPSTWTEISTEPISPPPYQLPLALLLAFKEAGIRPRSLILDLPFCDDMSCWNLSHEQLEDVNVLGQRIEVFGGFNSGCSLSRGPQAHSLLQHSDDLRPLAAFLRTLLPADRLKTLQLDLRGAVDQDFDCGVSDLVAIKPLPQIRSLTLRAAYFHLSDLQTFLSSQSDRVHIVLEDVSLLTGTWTEVLDLLHGKGTEGSDCNSVTGGEYPELSSELSEKVFSGFRRVTTNWATECIMGLRPNPLRGVDGSPIRDITNTEEVSEGNEWVSHDV